MNATKEKGFPENYTENKYITYTKIIMTVSDFIMTLWSEGSYKRLSLLSFSIFFFFLDFW